MYLKKQNTPVFASSCAENIARHFLVEAKKCKPTGSYRPDVFNL